MRGLLGLLLLAQSDANFKVDLNLIRVEVQVTEKGRPVMGLGREQFVVLDEGVTQPIVALTAEEQPLDLVLLVDLSGSMMRMHDELRANLGLALRQLRPVDRIGIVSFAMVTKMELGLTTEHEKAVAAVKTIAPRREGTEINFSVHEAASYLERNARADARRVILILTDNLGGRGVGDQKVIEKLWEADVVLHSVLFPHNMPHQFGEKHVELFSEATGGENYFGVELGVAFEKMRQRYALLYRAPEGKGNVARRIVVKLNAPGKYQVRYRNGYRPRLNALPVKRTNVLDGISIPP
jgi:VWFA-related protein